ncbi:hypothetical protein PITC_030860 [Penicillium italicum]|uniref:Uncharacterized protein n=1 Tax=Penicillium italicum TaxID=40296 RepID=A0A0A2L6I0_PENIT|nr:hypothetical protein PITC_030860 [Penicillium italicum]
MIEAHNLSTQAPVYSLPISGDERRDFEGVGGWRSYRASKSRSSHTPHEKATSSTSSSSTRSTGGSVDPDEDIDSDERAWLSLNNRLELPSQLITLCTSVHSGSTLNSLESADWRNGRNLQSQTGAQGIYPEKQQDSSRHHHRSLTTSSLTTSDRRTGTGLSLALSTRPDNAAVHSREYGQSMLSSTARPMGPFITPQPLARLVSNSHSQSRALPHAFHASGAPFTSSYLSSFGDGLGHSFGSNGSGGSGYFSLRRPGSSGSHNLSGRVSPSTSGYTTPAVGLSTEERDASSVGLGRLMAHYPTSPRHRRQSISGPNSRGLAAGDRAG